MVPWSERLAYSFLSAVVAGAAVGGGWYCLGGFRPPNSPFEVVGLEAYSQGVALGSFPAFLIAVPLVLAVRNYRGLRLYWILPLGSAIGPLWIVAVEFYHYSTDPPTAIFQWTAPVVWILATVVSVLATSFYVLLVRWAQVKQSGDAASASPEVRPLA